MQLKQLCHMNQFLDCLHRMREMTVARVCHELESELYRPATSQNEVEALIQCQGHGTRNTMCPFAIGSWKEMSHGRFKSKRAHASAVTTSCHYGGMTTWTMKNTRSTANASSIYSHHKRHWCHAKSRHLHLTVIAGPRQPDHVSHGCSNCTSRSSSPRPKHRQTQHRNAGGFTQPHSSHAGSPQLTALQKLPGRMCRALGSVTVITHRHTLPPHARRPPGPGTPIARVTETGDLQCGSKPIHELKTMSGKRWRGHRDEGCHSAMGALRSSPHSPSICKPEERRHQYPANHCANVFVQPAVGAAGPVAAALNWGPPIICGCPIPGWPVAAAWYGMPCWYPCCGYPGAWP